MNYFFSWTFDFVIDNFSRFSKRLGRGWTWIRGGKFQPVLIVYNHDETGLALSAFGAVDIQHVELADQISEDDCAIAGHSD